MLLLCADRQTGHQSAGRHYWHWTTWLGTCFGRLASVGPRVRLPLPCSSQWKARTRNHGHVQSESSTQERCWGPWPMRAMGGQFKGEAPLPDDAGASSFSTSTRRQDGRTARVQRMGFTWATHVQHKPWTPPVGSVDFNLDGLLGVDGVGAAITRLGGMNQLASVNMCPRHLTLSLLRLARTPAAGSKSRYQTRPKSW